MKPKKDFTKTIKEIKFTKQGVYWIEMKTASGVREAIFDYSKSRGYLTQDKRAIAYIGKNVKEFFKLYKKKN